MAGKWQQYDGHIDMLFVYRVDITAITPKTQMLTCCWFFGTRKQWGGALEYSYGGNDVSISPPASKFGHGSVRILFGNPIRIGQCFTFPEVVVSSSIVIGTITEKKMHTPTNDMEYSRWGDRIDFQRM